MKSPKFTTMASPVHRFAQHWALFRHDFERGDKVLRRMGRTASEAFEHWCGLRANPKRQPSRPNRQAPTSTRASVVAATMRRHLKRQAARSAVPAPYRYHAGQQLIGRHLPGWPVFEATRSTNQPPGSSTSWVMVGRQA
jgi:hypothetical protein